MEIPAIGRIDCHLIKSKELPKDTVEKLGFFSNTFQQFTFRKNDETKSFPVKAWKPMRELKISFVNIKITQPYCSSVCTGTVGYEYSFLVVGQNQHKEISIAWWREEM